MIKKILLGITTLSCVTLASQDTNLYLKTGADMWQKFDIITPKDMVKQKIILTTQELLFL